MIGETGALIVGCALVLAGALLVTGASAGAVLRRSGSVVRQAGTVARRSLDSLEWVDWSDDDAVPDASSPGSRSRPPRRGRAG